MAIHNTTTPQHHFASRFSINVLPRSPRTSYRFKQQPLTHFTSTPYHLYLHLPLRYKHLTDPKAPTRSSLSDLPEISCSPDSLNLETPLPASLNSPTSPTKSSRGCHFPDPPARSCSRNSPRGTIIELSATRFEFKPTRARAPSQRCHLLTTCQSVCVYGTFFVALLSVLNPLDHCHVSHDMDTSVPLSKSQSYICETAERKSHITKAKRVLWK